MLCPLQASKAVWQLHLGGSFIRSRPALSLSWRLDVTLYPSYMLWPGIIQQYCSSSCF
jgi:hypothetical protein